MESLPDEVRIRYESGNAHAPTGSGAIRVDVHNNDSVRLINDRHGAKRVWLAWLEPTFASAFTEAITKAGFPNEPSVMTAPPGTRSIALMVRRADGAVDVVNGFPSPEYKHISMLFMRIVAQMTGSSILGFVPEIGITLVRDAVAVAD